MATKAVWGTYKKEKTHKAKGRRQKAPAKGVKPRALRAA
jgi:hypothetical protein